MRSQERDERSERMHGPNGTARRGGPPPRFLALALLAALAACRTEPGTDPPILIEPGESVAVAPMGDDAPREAVPDEVVIVERAPVPPAAPKPGPAELPRAPLELSAEADDSLPATAAEPDVLPIGTPLPAELRTPLHTATSRVGDRVAARLLEPVEIDGRVVLPAGTLLEGRVTEVVSTEGADSLARIGLAFRHVRVPSGRRLALEAGFATPPGRSVERARVSPAVGSVGGAAAGAVLGGVLGGRRATGIGAVLGSVAGAAIVAAARDREVIVPSGTPLELVLIAPFPVPPAEDRS